MLVGPCDAVIISDDIVVRTQHVLNVHKGPEHVRIHVHHCIMDAITRRSACAWLSAIPLVHAQCRHMEQQ